MALSIKDPDTDALVRKLARARGTSFTGAIRLAVENELAREAKGRRSSEDILARVREIQDRYATFPVSDDREPDDLIGYDENGLPS